MGQPDPRNVSNHPFQVNPQEDVFTGEEEGYIAMFKAQKTECSLRQKQVWLEHQPAIAELERKLRQARHGMEVAVNGVTPLGLRYEGPDKETLVQLCWNEYIEQCRKHGKIPVPRSLESEGEAYTAFEKHGRKRHRITWCNQDAQKGELLAYAKGMITRFTQDGNERAAKRLRTLLDIVNIDGEGDDQPSTQQSRNITKAKLKLMEDV